MINNIQLLIERNILDKNIQKKYSLHLSLEYKTPKPIARPIAVRIISISSTNIYQYFEHILNTIYNLNYYLYVKKNRELLTFSIMF